MSCISCMWGGGRTAWGLVGRGPRAAPCVLPGHGPIRASCRSAQLPPPCGVPRLHRCLGDVSGCCGAPRCQCRHATPRHASAAAAPALQPLPGRVGREPPRCWSTEYPSPSPPPLGCLRVRTLASASSSTQSMGQGVSSSVKCTLPPAMSPSSRSRSCEGGRPAEQGGVAGGRVHLWGRSLALPGARTCSRWEAGWLVLLGAGGLGSVAAPVLLLMPLVLGVAAPPSSALVCSPLLLR